ncbi:MAG: secretin N-terminal domain-containing protein [Verrucomicrobiota bacterium]
MKANKQITLLAMLACFSHAAIFADDSKTNAPAAPAPASAAAEKTPAPDTVAPAAEAEAVHSTPVVMSENDKGLRFNFRGAPLEMVLNYLSGAAGFIIVLETSVGGKVDLWSNQPLNKEEAVGLLNTVLEKNGLTAIRNDRTLTVMKREDAKKRDIPVRSGSNPESIPKSNDMVTQVLPVGALNVMQLAKDLQTIVPDATLTANEAGNALVMTDTQTHIRRIAEIIKALDGSTASALKVFSLKFADSKAVAAMLKELFPSQSSSSSQSGDPRAFFGRRFGGGPGEDGGGGQERGSSGKGNSATHVNAVADENSNSVVVSAPEELMSTIEALINEVDASGDSAAEVRVFHLKFADPQEMADLLTSLFPDENQSAENTRSAGFRFGGFPFGGPPQGNSRSTGSSAESDRMKKKSRVLAVADRRTASIVVTADKDLMTQIGAMVTELDSNPAKKQKVFVYSLENADPQDVQTILQGLFQSDTTRNTTSTTSQNNPLTTRNNTTTSGAGATTGFGQNSGVGATGR